jgi:hypothetical protein
MTMHDIYSMARHIITQHKNEAAQHFQALEAGKYTWGYPENMSVSPCLGRFFTASLPPPTYPTQTCSPIFLAIRKVAN